MAGSNTSTASVGPVGVSPPTRRSRPEGKRRAGASARATAGWVAVADQRGWEALDGSRGARAPDVQASSAQVRRRIHERTAQHLTPEVAEAARLRRRVKRREGAAAVKLR